MRRRPQEPDKPSVTIAKPTFAPMDSLGLVLSGGGSRAAYQAGALKALIPYVGDKGNPISVIVGSSIGAINGLVIGACLKDGFSQSVDQLEELWRERTFKNTFAGSASKAFFRAIKMATIQYAAPGPSATSSAIFDPSPLMNRIDEILGLNGGLTPENRSPELTAIGVMTTVEGSERKPLLFLSTHKHLDEEVMTGASFDVCYVDALSAKHGFASAALPSVLPPVELDTDAGKVRLVDGGISQNIPVDPAVRMGAKRVIVVDISGRSWWLDRYGEAHDTRPTWEVPAGLKTFCMRPPDTFVMRNPNPLGPILKAAVSSSTGRFIRSVGPVWPLFQLLKTKLGEDVAYEVMSYVALDQDYIHGLIEAGYQETLAILKNKSRIEFQRTENFEKWAKNINELPPSGVEATL